MEFKKTSFAIYVEAFRNSKGPSFKGAVASFYDIISVKNSLLFTEKNMNQICHFCKFIS